MNVCRGVMIILYRVQNPQQSLCNRVIGTVVVVDPCTSFTDSTGVLVSILWNSDVDTLVAVPLWSVVTTFVLCLEVSSPCAGNVLYGDSVSIGSTACRIGIVFLVCEPELLLVAQSKINFEICDVVCWLLVNIDNWICWGHTIKSPKSLGAVYDLRSIRGPYLCVWCW